MKNRGKSQGPRFQESVDRSNDSSMVPIVREAQDLITIVGGGAGGKSMFLPTAVAFAPGGGTNIDGRIIGRLAGRVSRVRRVRGEALGSGDQGCGNRGKLN
jgi:hypothetical protein